MSQSPLANYWRRWREKVDSLKTRERALVLLTGLVVIYMLWDIAIFSPLAAAKSKSDQQILAVEQKISAMEQKEKAILLAVSADPDRDLKQQINMLEQQLEGLNASLAELSLGLIPVEKLASILDDVLRRTGKLKLQSLRTLPVEAMVIKSAKQTQADQETGEQSAGVYKHQVALTVKGDYRELLLYLNVLEAMDWRFYWDELHFEESTYPDSLITLHVYTLSTDEGLFGV